MLAPGWLLAEAGYARVVAAAATTDVRVVTALAWLPGGAAAFAAAAALLLNRPAPARSRARTVLGVGLVVLFGFALVEFMGSTGGKYPGAEMRALHATPAGAAVVAGAVAPWAGLMVGGLVAARLRRRGGDPQSPRRRRYVALSIVAGSLAGLAVALLTR